MEGYSIGLQCTTPIPALGLAPEDCVVLRAQSAPALIRYLPDALSPVLEALRDGKLVSVSGQTVGEILNTLAPHLPASKRRSRLRFRPDGRADLHLVR